MSTASLPCLQWVTCRLDWKGNGCDDPYRPPPAPGFSEVHWISCAPPCGCCSCVAVHRCQPAPSPSIFPAGELPPCPEESHTAAG